MTQLFQHLHLKIQGQSHKHIMLHNYSFKQFQRTSKSIQHFQRYVFHKVWTPVPVVSDLTSFRPMGKDLQEYGQTTMTLHNYRSRQFHRTWTEVMPITGQDPFLKRSSACSLGIVNSNKERCDSDRCDFIRLWSRSLIRNHPKPGTSSTSGGFNISVTVL